MRGTQDRKIMIIAPSHVCSGQRRRRRVVCRLREEEEEDAGPGRERGERQGGIYGGKVVLGSGVCVYGGRDKGRGGRMIWGLSRV